MKRLIFSHLAILALIQIIVGILLSQWPSLAKEWTVRGEARGTLRVVDLQWPELSAVDNYAEGLVTLDKDNNWVPCLAEDWRWINERTIEFRLRKGVTFHNGEEFNGEAVKVNWDEYRKMKNPQHFGFLQLHDETVFELVDKYLVRFTFAEPEGLALSKFKWFIMIAPAFFANNEFGEGSWGLLHEAGPWGTGPFRFVEGKLRMGMPSDRLVLEAYEDYWDRQYPKVERLIFDNTLVVDRQEAMRLCREEEGSVDIVTFIRPLDTLKVAESPFAKVVKSRDVTSLVGTFNERKTASKWRDIRLRQAVNYAINREELWKYGAKGNAYNLEGHFIPPGAYGHNPDLTLFTYDTTKARSLLVEAGYPEGFEVKLITHEAWKVEAQIMSRMLERIGLKVRYEILSKPEWYRKTYIPALDKPPEEQDWDMYFGHYGDWYGNTGLSFLNAGFLDESHFRWIEHDPVYEQRWRDMARTVDTEAQEEKIRELVKYVYDQAHLLFIYSPITLYAANKEVDLVPQKCQ